MADIADMRLLAGELCLDLANTVDPRDAEPHVDYLDDYADLLQLTRRSGALDDVDTAALAARAEAHPKAALEALARTRDLRESVYRAFRAIARHEQPAATDLASIHHLWIEREQAGSLRRRGRQGPFRLDAAVTLDRPAWDAARSAVELLASPELDRVGQCPGDSCGWLFVDRSRNASRRWCSMDSCGSRAKMRALYRRRRS